MICKVPSNRNCSMVLLFFFFSLTRQIHAYIVALWWKAIPPACCDHWAVILPFKMSETPLICVSSTYCGSVLCTSSFLHESTDHTTSRVLLHKTLKTTLTPSVFGVCVCGEMKIIQHCPFKTNSHFSYTLKFQKNLQIVGWLFLTLLLHT